MKFRNCKFDITQNNTLRVAICKDVGDFFSSSSNLHFEYIIISRLVRVYIRLIIRNLKTKESQFRCNQIKMGFLYTLVTKVMEVFSTKTSILVVIKS